VRRSVVQVDASQGRRGRDTGSYVDRVIGCSIEQAHSGLKMVVRSPADVVSPWFCEAVTESGAGSCVWALPCRLEHED
jgi:hypothetical protein